MDGRGMEDPRPRSRIDENARCDRWDGQGEGAGNGEGEGERWRALQFHAFREKK